MLTFPPVQAQGHHGRRFPAEHPFSHAEGLKSGVNEAFGFLGRESSLRADDAERLSRQAEHIRRHEGLPRQAAFQKHLTVFEVL